MSSNNTRSPSRSSWARLLLAIACWPLLFSAESATAAVYSKKYDAAIEKAAKRWLPLYPSWKRGKAQLIQESQLDPAACSQVGACGLGQFMPGTWADMVAQMGWDGTVSRHDPDRGIEAWAYYQGRLYQMWKSDRTNEDRISLAEASYNAGAGNILKAQARCGGPPGYDAIMACLEQITGIHYRETVGYTRSIRAIWRRLELGG